MKPLINTRKVVAGANKRKCGRPLVKVAAKRPKKLKAIKAKIKIKDSPVRCNCYECQRNNPLGPPVEKLTVYGTTPATVKLGNMLGAGSNKMAYAMAEDATKVVLVASSWQVLQAEVDFLTRIEKLGMPVVKVYEMYPEFTAVGLNATWRAAMIQERAAAAERGREGDQDRLRDVLNERTIESINEIRAAIKAHNVYIGDLQFLFRADGTALIADPNNLMVGAECTKYLAEHPYHSDNKGILNKVERGAMYAIEQRAGRVAKWHFQYYNTPSFWSSAENWYARDYAAKLERAMADEAAKQDIYTQRWQLVEIAK